MESSSQCMRAFQWSWVSILLQKIYMSLYILSTVVNTVHVCTCLSIHVHMCFYVFTFMQLYSFVLGLKILGEWNICILRYFMFFQVYYFIAVATFFIFPGLPYRIPYYFFYLPFCFIQSVPRSHLLILLFPLPFLISQLQQFNRSSILVICPV